MNCPKCGAPETDYGRGGFRLYFECGSYGVVFVEPFRIESTTPLCRAQEALNDAADLLNDIMTGQCNAEDEAEKWLRAYSPEHLDLTNDPFVREPYRRK